MQFCIVSIQFHVSIDQPPTAPALLADNSINVGIPAILRARPLQMSYALILITYPT